VPFRGCHAQSWPSRTGVVSGCGPQEFQRIRCQCHRLRCAHRSALRGYLRVSGKVVESGRERGTSDQSGEAFFALINTLIVCLFALIPGNGFGEATFILAVVGLTSTVGLIIFFLRNRRRDEPIRAGQILLIAGSLVLYAFQLVNGAELWRSPHHASHVTTQAEILIVFFIIAIARAWDLVGARDTSFVAGVVGMARGRRDEVGGPGTKDEAWRRPTAHVSP
jgi:hypothetical protein